MKNYFTVAVAAGLIFTSACGNKDTATDSADVPTDNPFYTEWNTPFGAPPFEKIKPEHYRQAIDSGFIEQNSEIEAIANSADTPSFENTILAMENSGKLLYKASSVFYNVVGADGDDVLKAIEEEYAPKFTQHTDEINMNEKLFARVKTVYDQRSTLKLDSDDMHLLELYYKNFVRGGTNLPADKKEELKKINANLSKLTTLFGQKLLADNNEASLVVGSDSKGNLKGIPEANMTAAAELAKKNGHNDSWEFNTSKPSWIPFMQFCENRSLREIMYKLYVNRGNNGNSNDTKSTIEDIAVLRTKKANLLGYKTWADYVISDNMAKTAAAANKLLADVAKTTIPYAQAEAKELQAMANKMGDKITIEPWDWWYYSEKVRMEKYDLNEDMIRQYLPLDNVLNGVFDLCNRLYGLKFKELKDMPKYNKDLFTYEVLNSDDSHLGVMYFDFFPRTTKRAGAWMNAIREEWFENGKRLAPIIINVHNLTPPANGNITDLHNALLSMDEAETVFHEFGHALQGLFANTKYRSTSGTNVSRDYVELPSQILENWTANPVFIKTFAKHYKTGEVIPDSLIAKLEASSKFNQGFTTMELIAASILDMDWHSITDTNKRDAAKFEAASMKKMGLIKEILPRYSSWYFNHIWGSDFGYSAGYYGYTWAAVLDADAFHAFIESGNIFNKDLAAKFRDNVLSLGNSYDADVLYRNFRGKDATPAAFYERKGFVKK